MKKKAKSSEVGNKKPCFNYGAMYTLGGGPACCHGEGETGTGGDESQAVVNSALSGWEGRSPDRPACWEEEAPGGGPGNEVRQQKTYTLLPLFMITRKADAHGQTHPIPNWRTHLSKHGLYIPATTCSLLGPFQPKSKCVRASRSHKITKVRMQPSSWCFPDPSVVIEASFATKKMQKHSSLVSEILAFGPAGRTT